MSVHYAWVKLHVILPWFREGKKFRWFFLRGSILIPIPWLLLIAKGRGRKKIKNCKIFSSSLIIAKIIVVEENYLMLYMNIYTVNTWIHMYDASAILYCAARHDNYRGASIKCLPARRMYLRTAGYRYPMYQRPTILIIIYSTLIQIMFYYRRSEVRLVRFSTNDYIPT